MTKAFGGTPHKLVQPGYKAPRHMPLAKDRSVASLKNNPVPRSVHSTPGNRAKGGLMGSEGSTSLHKPASSRSSSLKRK
jgi:hypothetical protein